MLENFLYSVEREYPVNIHALWNAWVEAEVLQAWYSPTNLNVLAGTAASDARVGGEWAAVVEVREHNATACFYGEYTEVEHLKRLVHTMQFTMDLEEFNKRIPGPLANVAIDFEDRGDSSWVRFSQFGVLPADDIPRAQAGMESYFDNLGIYLNQVR
jgi:uncharacterized protein YndB with AHSA1/START domain